MTIYGVAIYKIRYYEGATFAESCDLTAPKNVSYYVCFFQMSTTTENGMGGPWSTSREKTYKKVMGKQTPWLTPSLCSGQISL